MRKTHKQRKRYLSAYMTVEAAFVFPMVLGIVFLLIYLWFFQYDRCLVELDAGILALRGAVLQADDTASITAGLEEEQRKITWDKYICWEQGEMNILWKHGKVAVQGKGACRFPGRGLQTSVDDESWTINVSCENTRLNPVAFLRGCRKLKGEK